MISIALAIVAVVSAQSPNAPYLTAKQEAAFYLAIPLVQKEIKATPEQVTKWTKLFQKSSQDQQTLYANAKSDASDETLAANDKAVEKLERETAETAIGLATPAQVQRVRQIALQRLSVEAFGKSDVQAELKFTAEQKSQVEGLVADYQKKLDDFSESLAKQLEAVPEPAAGDAAAQKVYQDKVNALITGSKASATEVADYRKATELKIMAALTPVQKTQYQTMLGKPFELGDKPQA